MVEKLKLKKTTNLVIGFVLLLVLVGLIILLNIGNQPQSKGQTTVGKATITVLPAKENIEKVKTMEKNSKEVGLDG